ncbi:hypothetical protein KSU1_C0513 [Candidatus Jettenia caeni]|uniref:Transposase n=1 Tax=Candidatus Jettenia caeni TaxID=247490 RepID=I3IK64_9BACT|nr:hypothetical protein KSU1_C0513 [Candidatus Jettenia caeni]
MQAFYTRHISLYRLTYEITVIIANERDMRKSMKKFIKFVFDKYQQIKDYKGNR